jgi:hypothetical protein
MPNARSISTEIDNRKNPTHMSLPATWWLLCTEVFSRPEYVLIDCQPPYYNPCINPSNALIWPFCTLCDSPCGMPPVFHIFCGPQTWSMTNSYELTVIDHWLSRDCHHFESPRMYALNPLTLKGRSTRTPPNSIFFPIADNK